MTEDDIIKLIQKSGLHAWYSDPSRDYHYGCAMKFAALIAAAEREECAKVAERMLRFYTQAVTGVPEAIRARAK